MIFKFEDKILKFLKENIAVVALFAAIIINFIIRYSLRDFTNSDLSNPLTSWYNELKATGGFAGLGHQLNDCSYNLPYLTLIAFFTYLPVNPADAFKVSSGIFDFIQAFAVAWFVFDITNKNRNKAILSFIIAISSPIVLLNSAGWGQCDSIYTAFAIFALIYLNREKFLVSFILLGISFGFKLQAIFVLPFFVYYYFTKRKFSILYFGIIPIVMEILSLPAVIAGRGFLDVFRIYLSQTDWYPKMSMNYPTFWNLLNNEYTISSADTYVIMKTMAVMTPILIIGCFMFSWIYNNIEINTTNMIYMTFVCVMTCVEFLPGMHERYGYTAEILLIVMMFISWKVIPLVLAQLLILITTYGNFLFDQLVNFTTMAWLNAIVYFATMIYITYEMVIVSEKKGKN
ncbi:glycosyltransferase 87 family protein [Pseudobutyrivibrio ruminis]|uniref:glycosyltransferase 87 family protein n=1 Tax=Pseudobutyrivibrio ruminis TaxID=46206 RepID=UPI00068DAADA|nr:glycosyltransferase 87 family protein [Pseudobutyrivibrio ruminis]